MIGIGASVVIKDIRNGQDRFAAIVTGEEAGRYWVTRYPCCKTNTLTQGAQPVPQLLRLEGDDKMEGEHYVIESITGTSSELAKLMTDSIKTVTDLKAEVAALKDDLVKRDERRQKQVAAIVDTMGEFVEPDMAKSLKHAETTATPVKKAARARSNTQQLEAAAV